MRKRIVAVMMSVCLGAMMVSPTYAATTPVVTAPVASVPTTPVSEALMTQIVNDLIQYASVENDAICAVAAYPAINITADACNVISLGANSYVMDAINLCGNNPELQATKACLLNIVATVPNTVDATVFGYSAQINCLHAMNALTEIGNVCTAHGYSI